jgi:hypothetical protein
MAASDPEAKIDVSGLGRFDLVKALWLSTKPAVIFGGGSGPAWDEKRAKVECGPDPIKSVDYVCGRPIKVSFDGNTMDGGEYNIKSLKPASVVVAELRKGTFQAAVPAPSTARCRGCGEKDPTAQIGGIPVCTSCKHMSESHSVFASLIFISGDPKSKVG